MAPKSDTSHSRLSVRYLDDEILLSATHAWTYLRLPLLSYEFQSYSAREAFVDQISLALSTVVTNNSEPVDCHLRIVHRPFDVDAWTDQLQGRTQQQRPTPGWGQYLGSMANHVDGQMFDTKEVYLGVCLGMRGGKGNVSDLLDPVKFFTSLAERAIGVEEHVIPDAEINEWRTKARDVHRALSNSHLKALPATSQQVAWVVARPLWPEMVQPDPSYSGVETWGPGEVRSLVEGTVTHHRKFIEVEQISEAGDSLTGFAVSLAVSRFPDVLQFPDQEPWIHFAAAKAFPVDFSIRMSIVPALRVAKDVGKKLADAKDQAQHIAESGTSVPLKVREQLEVATVLEYQIDKDRKPWAYARHRMMITGATAEEVTSRARTLIESYRELGIDVVWPTGDQMDLFLESMPGDRVRSTAYYQRQALAVGRMHAIV